MEVLRCRSDALVAVEFEVLVETPETAVLHAEELQEIFDQGLVLDSSDQLKALRQKIYASGEAGG